MDSSNSMPRAAYSVREVCVAIGFSKTSFYEAVSRGQLRTVKCGRRTLVPAGEVEAFMAQLASTSDGQRGGQ